MHYAALMAGLAISLVRRKKVKKVANHCTPFQHLYKKLKKAAKHVCDRKCKRFEDYTSVLNTQGQEVTMITIQSTTRVAGALLLVQNSIHSMHGLCFYGIKRESFESKNLLLSEWKQVANFEAIMRKARELCFVVQRNRVEVSAEIILILALVNVH